MASSTTYLLDRLSLAFESLTAAAGVAHELGRDGILGTDQWERLRQMSEEVGRLYVAIPREERLRRRAPGSVS